MPNLMPKIFVIISYVYATSYFKICRKLDRTGQGSASEIKTFTYCTIIIDAISCNNPLHAAY